MSGWSGGKLTSLYLEPKVRKFFSSWWVSVIYHLHQRQVVVNKIIYWKVRVSHCNLIHFSLFTLRHGWIFDSTEIKKMIDYIPFPPINKPRLMAWIDQHGGRKRLTMRVVTSTVTRGVMVMKGSGACLIFCVINGSNMTSCPQSP